MVGFLALVLIDLAVTVLGYVLQPKTGGTGAPPSQPTAPQATEGGVIPVVFGTCQISPNTLWSGPGSAIDVTKKGQHVGYIYSIGLQMGICMGQIDELVDIIFGSKSLKGEPASTISAGVPGLTNITVLSTAGYTTTTTALLPLGLSDRQAGEKCALNIDARNILGVKDPGGGVKGALDVYFGTSTQPANDYLTAKIANGRVSPYAGLVYAVFRDFEWGLSPQLPNIAFVVRRCPDNLGVSAYANISGDANPAEVIYDLLTNKVWGLGKTPALFDLATFQAAAATLHGEAMGYSFALTNSDSADNGISDVLRHIDGVLRRDPETGLTGLALTRADYTIDQLPVVDPSVASRCEWKPSSWSRTTNHVNVTYTARDFDFQPKVVTAENLANIQSAGEVRAETIPFLGFSNPTVAQLAAARSLKVISGGIGAARVTTNRQLSTIRKGGCFLLNWPAYGISNVVMRVTGITTGTLEDGTVEVDAVEDIFAIGDAIYTSPTALGDSVPISLDVQAPSDLNVLNITGTTALARWVYATGAEYTEVFIVAGATGSTAAGDRVAVLAANAPQSLLRGLTNTTEYTVGVRHRDAKGGASAAIFATFTTTTAAAAVPRPAAIDVMHVTDAGTGDASGPFGVVVGLYASDPSVDLVIERAPDISGAPDTAHVTTVATVLGSSETYSDALANDGAVRWYRTRHAIGGTLSDPTVWVAAVPAHLPATPVRPLPIDAQVDDSTTAETVSSGTLALGINDPQGRILTCEMRTRAGNGAWGGWTSETSATVALVEKQPSGIAYRVAAYDATNILRTYMFGSVVPFSAGSQPTVQIASLTADPAFRVLASITGDSDTGSIRAYACTGSAPTAADVIASGTTINGRNATFDFGIFAANTKVYVGVLGYNGAGAAGLQSQLVSGSVPTGLDFSPSVSVQSSQLDRTGTTVTLSMSGQNLPAGYNWTLYKAYASGGNYWVNLGNLIANSPVIASGTNSSGALPESASVSPPSDVPDFYTLVLTDTGGNWLADSTAQVKPTLPGITTGGVADWTAIPNAPTTIGGYGITDAYTKAAADARYLQSLSFAGLTSHPTTIGGYGITDAYTMTAADARYLQLSGGTLTGALAGTSATFSGALTVNDGITLNGAPSSYVVTSGYAIASKGVATFAQADNVATDYTAAAIMIHEAQFGGGTGYQAPRLAFHWGGVVASQVAIETSGRIVILNNPGTGYESFAANGIAAYGGLSVAGAATLSSTLAVTGDVTMSALAYLSGRQVATTVVSGVAPTSSDTAPDGCFWAIV